jgi:arylsulfatase A-like enzyme
MRIAFMAVLAAILVSLPAWAEPARPNIVAFVSDDMGWGQPGFQGGSSVATPHLDRLARDGVSLTQFYVQATCTPTRAAFLTGRYPFRTGTEERFHANDVAGMLTDERTLADALGEAGYFTAIFGKWHLGEWQKQHLPLQRGFQHQYGCYGAVIDSFDLSRGGIYDWHRQEQPLHEEGYSTFLIADEFERALAQHEDERPFFFYVPFNAVHGPHAAPPEFVARHNGDKQLAMLEGMDVAIGRMLEALEKKGVERETLVIFFNDNGGPRRIGNTPYRGYKKTTFEGGVRVACLCRWPGRIPAGSTVDELVHVTDLYPTLVNLAGGSLQQPLPLDGMDMWPTISQGDPSPRREIVFSVPELEQSETGQPAIRQDNYKLVEDELFDLQDDPYERHDLAAQKPEVVARLKARLHELASQRRSPEKHGKLPQRPAVKGELENSAPWPEWLTALANEAQPERDAEPNSARKAERKKSRQRLRQDQL